MTGTLSPKLVRKLRRLSPKDWSFQSFNDNSGDTYSANLRNYRIVLVNRDFRGHDMGSYLKIYDKGRFVIQYEDSTVTSLYNYVEKKVGDAKNREETIEKAREEKRTAKKNRNSLRELERLLF